MRQALCVCLLVLLPSSVAAQTIPELSDQIIKAADAIKRLSEPPPPPPPAPDPVDCVVSGFTLEQADAWAPAVCPSSGQQTRSESWVRTITTEPANGGLACPALTEMRTGTQSCTPPEPEIPVKPSALNTGVKPGTTLTNCSGNITQANATYTNCLFGSVTLAKTATGVSISNSRIRGVINGNYFQSGLTLTDVEIDGGNSTLDATNGLYGYTMIRVNCHHVAKCWTGNHFTVEDSYCHDLYGSGDSHNECVLGSSGTIVVRRSTIDSRFSDNSRGGGMSSAISLYTHSSFWPALSNVLIEGNWISAGGAVYCVYGGNSSDAGAAGDPSNVRFLNNIFTRGGCGSGGLVVGWLRGNGNVWSGNVYSDGAAIPEPGSNNYAGQRPLAVIARR